jgi:hypothetical protein
MQSINKIYVCGKNSNHDILSLSPTHSPIQTCYGLIDTGIINTLFDGGPQDIIDEKHVITEIRIENPTELYSLYPVNNCQIGWKIDWLLKGKTVGTYNYNDHSVVVHFMCNFEVRLHGIFHYLASYNTTTLKECFVVAGSTLSNIHLGDSCGYGNEPLDYPLPASYYKHHEYIREGERSKRLEFGGDMQYNVLIREKPPELWRSVLYSIT